ncbi:hypothetical protein D3C78_1249560 [compost metagenome]
MRGNAWRSNLGKKRFAHGIGGDFITDNNDAFDVGFFGPTRCNLAVDQTVIDTGKPDNHVIVRSHRFGRGGSFDRGGDRRGFLYRLCFEGFHAFTACFDSQSDQFVKARIVITGHQRFHEHRNVDAGNDLMMLFIDDNAAGGIERAATPCIDEKQHA